MLILLVATQPFVLRAKAQPDTIPENYPTAFQQNIKQISLDGTRFYDGKFRLGTENNFQEGYRSLKLEVSPEIFSKSEEYFHFFSSLPEDKKKGLVRLFSFYERTFEATLKKEGLPVGLKYLAPALSALNTNAVGGGKKAGIWQLTHFQALLNGGKVDRLVDERLDVFASTHLAALQLKQNMEMYHDAELAIVAFLAGNTAVRNAICQTGENVSIGEVLALLDGNVSDCLAAFQAMAVFLNINRCVPEPVYYRQKNCPDTVMVFRQLHFKQIEKVIGIPVAQTRELNPRYKFAIVPETAKGRKLLLPNGKKDDFVLWYDSINNAMDSSYFNLIAQKIEYPPAPNRQYLGGPVKDLQLEGKTKIKYRIKTGDVLGIIAETYDVKVADLKYWNNIANERRVQAGQIIDIFVPNGQLAYYKGLENGAKPETAGAGKTDDLIEKIQNTSALKVYGQFDTDQKIEHEVKSGESPFVIAKQYEGVTPELILEWNNIDDPRKIQVGQKLIIYPQK